jgi:hypothetical protein
VERLPCFVACWERYVLEVAGGVCDLGVDVLVMVSLYCWTWHFGVRIMERTCSPVSLVSGLAIALASSHMEVEAYIVLFKQLTGIISPGL